MPGRFLTLTEKERLNRFPEEIPSDDIFTFFTLSSSDTAQVPLKSVSYNRLGFALQLCTLRYLGFCPDNLTTTPPFVVTYVANQLDIESHVLSDYGQRDHTRTDHLQKIQDYLQFRKASQDILKNLSQWLIERALEHDKPTLLLQMACQKLYSEKIIRPGITILERMVISARQQAQLETYQKMEFLLTSDTKSFLDSILLQDNDKGCTPLFWLRFGSTANTPSDILNAIEKLNFLRKHHVEKWNLDGINPNRKKFLAQVGRRLSNQELQRAVSQRRYPILIAFLQRTYEEIIDELIELFDRCLGDCYSRAKGDLKEFRLSIAKTTNETLIILKEVGRIIADHSISASDVRERVYQFVPEEELRTILEQCNNLIRPKNDKSYDFFANRYSYIRMFAPTFLEALNFKSNQEDDSLLKALEILRQLNATGKRKVPEDAPLDFIGRSWIPYVKDSQNKIVRRYYEISALWELRGALRAGDIWIENSRQYADPESYLIPKEKWPSMRSEACRLLGLPEKGEERIKERQKELEDILSELDQNISKNDGVRIEKGKLVLTPFKAEELPESCITLQKLISKRLPRLDLTDLLIEVDSWTNFTDHFEHTSGTHCEKIEFMVDLYACLLAQACNFGLSDMAEASGLLYDKLAWCTNWYVREETLQKAINTLVNFQYHQPLSKYWGGGTMSSSDGQRFPVAVKARNTTIIPPYYGYGRILTYYSWSSDQFSQWGSKPIPSTVRDATYVLDAILDNETELPLFEHTTDTAGYTERIFGFFECLSYLFSPRIRDLGDQNIYRIDKNILYKNLDSILKGTINVKFILKHWDSILRVMASLKLGWVTASLFISKLQSHPRQSTLAKAIQEYGKLIKSIYIPKYICREDQQRRVSAQLNKGEALIDLRRWLLFANEGQLRKSQLQDQATQASALTLVTNAVIVWNTRYMQAVIDQLRKEGHSIEDADLNHISPCRFNHINKYGRYSFNIDEEINRKELRPLRKP